MLFPKNKQVHLWFVKLDEELYQGSNVLLLNSEEKQRALKFKFELHRKRYITARAGLRSILGLYLNCAPAALQIQKGPQGKPFIQDSELQFNLSHSHDRALYALSVQNPLGVDLEKIRQEYNLALAERFFSPEEYQRLVQLPSEQRRALFFKIWTGKEALVKAIGEGLGFPLSSFTIPGHNKGKEIRLEVQGQASLWYFESLALFQDYQAALVTQHPVSRLFYFEWTPEGKQRYSF